MTTRFDRRFGIWLVLLMSGVWFASGVLGLILARVSYAKFMLIVNSMAVRQGPGFLTADYYASVTSRLKWVAVLLCLAAVLLGVYREKVLTWSSKSLSAWRTSWKEFQSEEWTRARNAFRLETRTHLWLLGLVCLTGVGLRLAYLDGPMRCDESGTFLRYAMRPLVVGVTRYLPNNHIFHNILVHCVTAVFGISSTAIRLPTFIAGVLILPVSYGIVRRAWGKQTALLTAALLAVSHPLIEYSVNARGYTLMTLLFLLTLALGQRLVQRDRSTVLWVLWCVSSALGFYTIPIMLYPFGISCLWVLMNENRKKMITRLVTAGMATGVGVVILYSPVIVMNGIGSLVANPWVKPLGWNEFSAMLPSRLLSVWQSWHASLSHLWQGLELVGILLLLLSCIRDPKARKWSLFVLLSLLWVLAACALQRVVPYERVFLFFLPLGLISVAAGWTKWTGPRMAHWVSVLILLLGILSTLKFDKRAYLISELEAVDSKEAALYLMTKTGVETKILARAGAIEPLEYYFLRAGADRRRLVSAPPVEVFKDSHLVVVFNERLHGSLAEHRTKIYPSLATEYGPPRLLRAYDSLAVYLFDHR